MGGNYGVGLRIAGGSINDVFYNRIGVGASLGSIGLSGPGIILDGTTDGFAFQNVIANNAGVGIQVVGSVTGNLFLENSIHSNGDLGIDLGTDGVTDNDTGDADVGPNDLLNFPVLSSAGATGGSVTVSGTLNSAPSEPFNVHFYASSSCDPSGHGEGETFIRFITVVTDPNGNASFMSDLIGPVPAGDVITATTSDFARENTSEFSACLVAAGVPPSAVPSSGTFGGSGVETTWESVVGAQTYNLYRGVAADLPNLYPPPSLAPPVNSCLRWSGTTTGTGPILTETPPLDAFYWYLITAVGAYGESGSGSGTPGPRQLNPSGPCTGASCLHDKCIVGGMLEPSCGACVSDICSLDPFCCNLGWDELCISEARTICGSLTCLESRGTTRSARSGRS